MIIKPENTLPMIVFFTYNSSTFHTFVLSNNCLDWLNVRCYENEGF